MRRESPPDEEKRFMQMPLMMMMMNNMEHNTQYSLIIRRVAEMWTDTEAELTNCKCVNRAASPNFSLYSTVHISCLYGIYRSI